MRLPFPLVLPRPLRAAFVAFLLAAIAAASLIARLERGELQKRRAQASYLAFDHEDALQNSIERALSASYALELLIRQGNGTISHFNAVGRRLLSLYPGVSSLSLAPDGIIRDVAPLAGNENAIGIDLFTNPATAKEASIARNAGELTLTGPFVLASGKMAAIGRLPVFLDGGQGKPSFWGFVNVEVGFPKALQAANLPQLVKHGYAYQLWRRSPESGARLIIAASSSAPLDNPVEQPVKLPNANWTLSIAPAGGWGEPLRLLIEAALGILFSLLMAYIAKLLVELRAHRRELEALVEQRTALVRRREADLNEAQSIAQIGSWVRDPEANRMHWSAQTYRIFGVPAGTPVDYETLLEHIHPDDRGRVERAWQEALKGDLYDIKYRIVTDAGIRWVHARAHSQLTGDGTKRRYIGTVQDITERKLAEDALAHESYRNWVFLRNSSDGIHILDSDGNVLEISDSFAAMLGYSREELIGANVSLWDVQWSAQELKQLIAEQIAKQDGSVLETRHRRRDGSFFDVEITGHGLELDGKPVLFNSARDITDRKRAQDALRESEHQLRAIFDAAVDGILVADAETRMFLAANAAICGMLGYTREEILRIAVSDIHPKQDLPRAIAPFESLLHGAAQTAAEIPMLRKDGSVFYADIKAAPMRLGGRDCLLGIFRDVTQRKEAARELVESEARFRGLVDQSIAGICIIQEGKFVYVNPRFAEIFGYGSAEEMIAQGHESVVAEEDRNMVATRMRGHIEGELASSSFNFAGLRKDGTMIDVGMHGTRAIHAGRPAIIGLAQDISEKKRAEEQIGRYVKQLQTALMRTVDVATTLSEMRDPYTAGHERRVGEIAAAIGAELGFNEQRIEGLRVAGHLHDVGKMTVPSEILSKPGKLTPIEFQLIQGHPQSSYEVLKDVEFPWPVAEVALQHHERMDGSGYPQGLKGEAILLEARIMAVADVMEAMSSHRPYRPGLGIDKALAEIERGRGSAYDPAVADACLRLFRERGYRLPE
jgi:PAS domain S-box-containing protein